jgi:hypothetical protein
MSDDEGMGDMYLLGQIGDTTCRKCGKQKDIMEFPRAIHVIITDGAVTYHSADGKATHICNQCHHDNQLPSGN